MNIKHARNLALSLALAGSAACTGGNIEARSTPSPVELSTVVTSAAIMACNNGAEELNLPPQASLSCQDQLKWYMKNVTDGKWPDREGTPTDSNMSNAFRVSTNIVTKWNKQGYLKTVTQEEARNVLMDNMFDARVNLVEPLTQLNTELNK